MKPHIIAILIIAAIIAACSRSDRNAAVPRPTAYPRIEVYDSVYRAIDGLPLHFEINSGATERIDTVMADGSVWFSAIYPAYGNARLYATISPATPEVMANRQERLMMNTGGAPTEITEISSPGGFRSMVMVTPQESATPVQILSENNRYIVSGSIFLEGTHNPDSVRPVVEALRADMLHAAKTLR